jgi:hypothetical protein
MFVAVSAADSADDGPDGSDLFIAHFRMLVNTDDFMLKSQRSSVGTRQTTGEYSLVSVRSMKALHVMDITQIVALTDHESTLSFVTTSLDCLIKTVEIDELKEEVGEEDHAF